MGIYVHCREDLEEIVHAINSECRMLQSRIQMRKKREEIDGCATSSWLHACVPLVWPSIYLFLSATCCFQLYAISIIGCLMNAALS
jgi:hypothetical protein